ILEDGIYFIEIIASAKSWWQNLKSLKSFFNDDDLAVKIDDIEFPKLNGKKGLFDSEAAWNGNNLKGLAKTGIFIINLKKGNHTLNFLADQNPILESISVFKINDNEEINYIPEVNNPAQNGNRRQWMTISLANLSTKNLNVNAIAKKYSNNEDDDDIKLIIDGNIQENKTEKSHKNWFWCGRVSDGQEKEFNQELNLATGLHYIELWADRMPEIKSIMLNIDLEKSYFKEKATVVWEQSVLREEPNQKSQALIEEINKGAQVNVIEKAVLGERPANEKGIFLLSDRWHKVEFQGKTGYIYCEALEIEGENKEEIKKLILNKAKELNEDDCLMSAIAKRESKLFPYAVSGVGAQGLFQLREIAILDVNEKFGKKFSNRLDIRQSIESGILYWQIVKKKYKNKENFLEKTLAAWNWGMGNVIADRPLNLNNLPEETQQFIKEVIEMNNECKTDANKSGKISISWLIGIIILAVVLFFAAYFLFFEKKEFLLSEKYRDYSIIKENDIDVDKDGKNEKIIIISNISIKHTFGDTKIVMIKKDGTFLVISEYGSELQWRKMGDFNNNGKTDIAALYGYGGSAGFGKLYLHEWSGKGFDLLFSKEDVENTAEFKDLDDDGIEEIVYNFYRTKWGEKQQEIYKWNGDRMVLHGNGVSK
ncbi:transglycosylase SLT domain-containing protein, partial [Patescibacteria group bacterium]|nr:transglycosylase SLT domain-containing protein [Patescibacteria group bacterium]